VAVLATTGCHMKPRSDLHKRSLLSAGCRWLIPAAVELLADIFRTEPASGLPSTLPRSGQFVLVFVRCTPI